MLEVKNLMKKYGEKIAVNHVSFTVKKGRILGLLGRNGAGKSTIFRSILNLIEPEEGEILYQGKNIEETDMDKIGYLPEEGSLIGSYTVLEQCKYYGSLKSMKDKKIREELMKWLKRFEITDYMNRKIKDLSKGNRQKIQFIIAILHDPDLIILDEPFSGLDPISVEFFKEIILELKNKGKMIVFSSHIMEHVESLCEDILILDQGDVLLYGDLDEIKRNYHRQNIHLSGKIDEMDLKQIKEMSFVEEVIKKDQEKYVIKTKEQKELQEIWKHFKNSSISNFSLTEMSLNDIFLDKVGRRYEEQ